MSHVDAFILGSPRLGTTFLLEALAGADNVVAASRGYPSEIPVLWNAEMSDEAREVIRLSLKHLPRTIEEETGPSRGLLLRDVAQRRVGLAETMRGLVGGRRFDAIIYKEPFFSFAPELITSALHEARMIHIIRDGRDVGLSLQRKYDPLSDEMLTKSAPEGLELLMGSYQGGWFVPWWVPQGEASAFIDASPYVRCVWMWKEMVKRIRLFLDAEPTSRQRTITIRYEDLVSDPFTHGLKIFEHLGISMNRRSRKRLIGASRSSIGSFQRLPEAERSAATGLAATELQAFGYETAS